MDLLSVNFTRQLYMACAFPTMSGEPFSLSGHAVRKPQTTRGVPQGTTPHKMEDSPGAVLSGGHRYSE